MLSAVSTAVTGLIGTAFLGVLAGQAWQRWFEQKDAEPESVAAAFAVDDERARRES